MMNIGEMLKNIPEGAIENIMKDMTPEKLKDAFHHMPPEMTSMLEGMGKSREGRLPPHAPGDDQHVRRNG